MIAQGVEPCGQVRGELPLAEFVVPVVALIASGADDTVLTDAFRVG